MPWAILIIGTFLFVAASLMIPTLVTGTTSSDNLVRNVVPLGIAGLTLFLFVIGLFGGRR